MSYRLGVDVGGTFTDLLLFDEQSGAFWRHKTPSTPHDSSEGILNGVKAIMADAGITAADIAYFLHGTTVATNAVLEGKGARVFLDPSPSELLPGEPSGDAENHEHDGEGFDELHVPVHNSFDQA